jgi:hypothetical protein
LIGFDSIAGLASGLRRRAYRAIEAFGSEISMHAIAAGTGFVDEAHPRSLALHALAEPVEVALTRTDIAQVLHFARADCVGGDDRLLMDVQAHEDSAMVAHADLH